MMISIVSLDSPTISITREFTNPVEMPAIPVIQKLDNPEISVTSSILYIDESSEPVEEFNVVLREPDVVIGRHVFARTPWFHTFGCIG
jgi:hypothetical protein